MYIEDHYVGTDDAGRRYFQMGADIYTYTPNTGGTMWNWVTSRNLLAGRGQTLAEYLAVYGATFKGYRDAV
jgi:hypothetical protein